MELYSILLILLVHLVYFVVVAIAQMGRAFQVFLYMLCLFLLIELRVLPFWILILVGAGAIIYMVMVQTRE